MQHPAASFLSVLLIAGAASVPVNRLCCWAEGGPLVCTTDAGKGNGKPVSMTKDATGKVTATVKDDLTAPDGVYKCDTVAPVGEKVF